MDALSITFHPAKEQPYKAAALGFFLGIALRAMWACLEPISALGLWGVLVFSLRDFYLETRYDLSLQGLAIQGALRPRKEYPWARFRAFVEDKNGLFLSPYLAKRRTENQRGVFLAMTPKQRRQAVGFCETLELARRLR